MQSRRQWAKTGFAGLVMLNESRSPAIARQEITAETVDLTYQGMLATSNLPDLPKAAEGECAVVLQSTGRASSAAAVFHNRTDDTVYINGVSATGINEDGGEDPSVPEESLHAPLVLEPGDYGIATVNFPESWQKYSDVSIELDLRSEPEPDAPLVSMPVTEVQLVDAGTGGSLNLRTQNRSQDFLAEGSGFVGIFFTPDGQIQDWFTAQFRTQLEPGESKWITHVSSSLTITDSFLIGFTGRISR